MIADPDPGYRDPRPFFFEDPIAINVGPSKVYGIWDMVGIL